MAMGRDVPERDTRMEDSLNQAATCKIDKYASD